MVTQVTYTLTNFAEPTAHFSQEAITRYLRGARITPRLVWNKVRGPLVATPQGSVVCDDTVLDKHYSSAIERGCRQ